MSVKPKIHGWNLLMGGRDSGNHAETMLKKESKFGLSFSVTIAVHSVFWVLLQIVNFAIDKATSIPRPKSPRTNFYTWRDRNFIRVILQLSPCLTCSLLKGHLHIFSQLPIHYPVYLLNVFSDHSEAIIKCRFIIIWYRLWLHNKNSGLCVNFCYATYNLPPKSYS